jgi:hypothetical protein
MLVGKNFTKVGCDNMAPSEESVTNQSPFLLLALDFFIFFILLPKVFQLILIPLYFILLSYTVYVERLWFKQNNISNVLFNDPTDSNMIGFIAFYGCAAIGFIEICYVIATLVI